MIEPSSISKLSHRVARGKCKFVSHGENFELCRLVFATAGAEVGVRTTFIGVDIERDRLES